MNPIFIFLVLLGAVVLWFLLSGLYRIIGGVTKHYVDKAKEAMSDESNEPSKLDAFVDGFKDGFRRDDF